MKTITLSGPGKNALSTELMKRALREIRAEKDAPILLTGEGDAFSAGLYLKEVATLDVAGMTVFLGALEDLVKALYEHPAPVVAYVNGHAIAGGCILALCADIRVITAREGVRMGLNEVALGLRLPPITFGMLRARLVAPVLERVLLEASLYGAEGARALGLVDVIGEEGVARTLLSKLASHPPDVYAATKLQLRPRLEATPEERKRFREETIPHWASPDRQAEVSTVLSKRR
jgi:enoyl-CoA hydratase/carnithine racemase